MLSVGIWKVGDLYKDGKLVSFQTWQERGLHAKTFLLWRGLVGAVQKFVQKDVVTTDEPLCIHVKSDHNLYELKQIDTHRLCNIMV